MVNSKFRITYCAIVRVMFILFGLEVGRLRLGDSQSIPSCLRGAGSRA